jgi:BirA family biotin operon repressor/biotin-[acetyl-CoA-carboxylase] ligase
VTVVPKQKPLEVWRVKENLGTRTIGRSILYFRELASTNDVAKELAAEDAKEGTVVLAETQSEGRGRLGREWVSPPGGVWFSVILRPEIEPKHAPRLTLVVSVAVAKAISKLFSLRAEIKWPNDVLVNGKKVCGILTEAKTRGDVLDYVVVGVGVNADFDVELLPSSLRDSVATLLGELKRHVDREVLLSALLREIEVYYRLFSWGKFDVILGEWRSLAGFLGSGVRVVEEKGILEGTAVDVDEEGALILRLGNGTVRRVTFGDLAVLRVLK